MFCSHFLIFFIMQVYAPVVFTLVYMIFYFFLTRYFAHRKFYYLQQTTIATVVGIITGFFIYFLTDSFYQQDNQKFIRTVIILVLLPPILFKDGFHFPRRKFFQNIFYINLFGLLGTLINFGVTFGLLYVCNIYGLFVSVSDSTYVIYMHTWQLLILTSCLMSIEPVVTQKVVDQKKSPKLFSVIFGQVLYKDTIAITLFDSIQQMVENNSFDVNVQDIFILIGEFLQKIVLSVLIGVVIALIFTLIFKWFRFMVGEGTTQMAFTIISGYLCYWISEWLQFSGVISMLFCGITLSHYNYYNLSQPGKQATLIAIEVLKIMAVGMIFFFMGFQIFSFQLVSLDDQDDLYTTFSLSFLGLTLAAMIIGRIANVYLISLIGNMASCICGLKWRINKYEDFNIFLAGMMHGVVSFALASLIPDPQSDSSSCLQMNVIGIVLISSLIFNFIIPKLMRVMFSRIRWMYSQNPQHPSFRDSFNISLKTAEAQPSNSISQSKNIQQTNKNQQIHPVIIQSSSPSSVVQECKQQPLLSKQYKLPVMTRMKSRTSKFWRKFQEGVLKPFFIYDYYNRKEQIKMGKLKIRQQQYQHRLMQLKIAQQENLLNIDKQSQNRFIQVRYAENSDSDSYSDQQQDAVLKIKKTGKKYNQKKKQKQSQDIEIEKNKREFMQIEIAQVNRMVGYTQKGGRRITEGQLTLINRLAGYKQSTTANNRRMTLGQFKREISQSESKPRAVTKPVLQLARYPPRQR